MVTMLATMKDLSFDEIDLNMEMTRWFDADMCAIFGAFLYKLAEAGNEIKLSNIRPEVETILSKNCFLSHHGKMKIPDTYSTTIPYQRFDIKDDRYFAEYIENELMIRTEMPTMTAGLLKKFQESIFEIFSNAVIHSETKNGIFCCGQLFPRPKKLHFSIVDLGVGIPNKVNRSTGLSLSSSSAIKWATQGSNTTKRGLIPGGLGLKLLGEFIVLNSGSLQILSDTGYYISRQGKISTHELGDPFPGTLVNIEINTADVNSYYLASEVSEDDIF